jgi:hypothetical protein
MGLGAQAPRFFVLCRVSYSVFFSVAKKGFAQGTRSGEGLMIIRVQGCGKGKQGERTGDGRVRSESWHVFWIGSERLSEIEHYLRISACVEGAMMRAPGRREEKTRSEG